MEIKTSSDLKQTIKLVRPKITLFLFLVVLMGIKRSGSLNIDTVTTAFLISIFHGLSVFAINDYFDFETDQYQEQEEFKGKTADKSNRQFIGLMSIAGVLMLLASIWFVPFLAGVALIGIAIFSFIYSAPPVRLKTRPILDSSSNALWIFLTFMLGLGLAGEKIGSIGLKPVFLAVILGGFHALASLPDIEADRKAGIMTTGRLLGWRPTIVVNFVLVITAILAVQWSFLTNLALLTYLGFCTAIFVKPDEKTFYRSLKVCWLTGIVYVTLWLLVL